MRYIDVVIDNKSEYTDSFFTYRAPDEIAVGDKVRVPFARRPKGAEGYVFAVDVAPSVEEKKIREVEAIEKTRSLTEEMIRTAVWMRTRYGVKYIDAVKMFAVNGKREKESEAERPEREREIPPALTEEQAAAVQRIGAAVRDKTCRRFLLHGVTNSGKTEVYLRAAEEALSLGRSAIVLVPEIALAAQTADRFRRRFGEGAVAILHSKLTTSQRLAQWLRIRDGRAKIVIGARTAVFAPVTDLGVLILDEEHESTYKSDHNPKYETIDIAYKRTAEHGATLILGSATPSIVSYSRARQGVYELLEMKNRIGKSVLPEVEIVDMRKELREGNTSIISAKLMTAMREVLANGEQVILFLNRRGFATHILCPECGFRMTCPDCGITLTHHKRANAAVCHYCGRKFPLPAACPECGSKYLKYTGAGTEKVEETIERLFPDAVTERFDLDTVKSQRDIDKMLRAFRRGKTDILVGTQILAKGLDFKNVGLVGIILADVTLNLPDYRSAERTFQLITQVSGRAGRGEGESRVLIQTYEPEDETIVTAAQGDYARFYDDESFHRKIMNYPPYSDIISVLFTDKKGHQGASETMERAQAFRRHLLSMNDAPKTATVFAPKEDPLYAGGERRRVYFLIKAPKGTRSGYLRACMNYRDRMIREGADCYIEADVNPYGIL